ncbi:hypothetical protein [Flagellimonas onchidii]|uniref:hypothetical protein n=1 Tax=Flagellimonas onchidii TaxID=2562684 RepID=UPI0010A6866E|nr:hypothetical protein [Allomuricauda onchidii]
MANSTIKNARKRTQNQAPKEHSIAFIELSSYEMPEVKETVGKDWVLFGKNNQFFDDLLDRYKTSTTNMAIIDRYAKLIYGKGLVTENPELQDTIKRLFPKKDVRKITKDLKLFGSATIQVIYSKGKGTLRKVTGAFHIPRQSVAPNKLNEDGDITHYWHCQDWKQSNKIEPIAYPAFGTSREEIEILEIELDKVDNLYYALPDYIASLNYSKMEDEIGNYFVNHIQNGLSAGFVINYNNGVPTKELRDKVERTIKNSVTGSANAGKVIISFNDNKEAQTTVEAFPTNTSHKQWEFCTNEARTQIMLGHRVTSPMLFGIKDNTGLGNNAEELETATKLLYAMEINPIQEIILDGFHEILKVNGIQTELEFEQNISFVKEDGTKQDEGEAVEMSKHQEQDNFTANALIAMGQDESDLEGYTLIASQPVNVEPKLEFEAHLADAVQSSPSNASNQDNVLFKVRYVYAPQSVSDNSREFCRKMVQAGKVYRKEDIEQAGQLVINAGLGAGGADTYSIWRYKGCSHDLKLGVNCKHFWERRVYLKTNNKQISVNEAQRMILDLDPEKRDLARLPQNEKEVAQSASPSNNHWKLN